MRFRFIPLAILAIFASTHSGRAGEKQVANFSTLPAGDKMVVIWHYGLGCFPSANDSPHDIEFMYDAKGDGSFEVAELELRWSGKANAYNEISRKRLLGRVILQKGERLKLDSLLTIYHALPADRVISTGPPSVSVDFRQMRGASIIAQESFIAVDQIEAMDRGSDCLDFTQMARALLLKRSEAAHAN